MKKLLETLEDKRRAANNELRKLRNSFDELDSASSNAIHEWTGYRDGLSCAIQAIKKHEKSTSIH